MRGMTPPRHQGDSHVSTGEWAFLHPKNSRQPTDGYRWILSLGSVVGSIASELAPPGSMQILLGCMVGELAGDRPSEQRDRTQAEPSDRTSDRTQRQNPAEPTSSTRRHSPGAPRPPLGPPRLAPSQPTTPAYAKPA
eukprot:scaffold104648_cov61-Phaeocystis_antarctica.AAC.5